MKAKFRLQIEFQDMLGRPFYLPLKGARRTIDSIELLTDTTTQSDMLDNVLKKYELRDLYPKFERAGVVADIIWELDENMLSDSGLNAIEKHRYKKAKAK